MKKILIISLFLLTINSSEQLYGQFPRLELTLTTIQESAQGIADAEIHLNIDGERPPYICQLFDKAPWEGGKELANSQKIYENQYVFKNLTSNNYFVCVTDAEENSDCEIIQITND